MSWFFCVFFTLLTTLPCILHAGTTVRMKFARGRCIKNDTNQTYYHYPSQFQQNNPVRNPNGLFLLTVDKIGGALIYPIRLQGKKPFIMIYNLTKKQLSENVYSHCMFVPNAPTAECQWAYLNGTSINKPFIQYQTIDPLTAERYTATEDDKCYSSGSSRRSEQCMRWFRTKNNAKNATKTTSIKTQYTIFTQNVKFNKESLPGHWLIQPLPNSYRYKVKKVQESPSITKINQEVQYANELNADSAMAQGRLKRRFLKQMLALPVLQAFRGVSSVHNFVRLIKRIMLRVNVIPDWMVHGLNRFTGLLSRWFTMGPIDTSFSYLDAMQNNSYITQFAFSSTCPEELVGEIDFDLVSNEIVYAEVVGLSRGCVNTSLVISHGTYSKEFRRVYKVYPVCNWNIPRYISSFCLEGVYTYNGPTTNYCINNLGRYKFWGKRNSGFLPHTLIGANLMSGKKVKSKCSKAQISYANQKYEIYNFNIETVKSIFEKPKWTIMVEMVPDAPCPPHVRMSVIEDNDLIFHIYGNNTNGVLRGEIEWSNSLKKDPTILLTNFMLPYGHYSQTISWNKLTLFSPSKNQVYFYNYLVTVYTNFNTRPEYSLCINKSSVGNCQKSYLLDRFIMFHYVLINEKKMFIWQQTINCSLQSYEICRVHVRALDSQNCAKAHRVEFMSLVDGKLLNAYICDKKFEPILHLINQMNSSYAPLANQPHPNQTQTYPGYPSQQNVTLGNSNPQNSQQTLNSAINSPPFNPSFQQQIPSGPTGANYFAPPFPGQTGSTGENASYFNST